jgi:hypothetical protein
MNDEDNQPREQAVRDKIARQMRSIGHAPTKQPPGEELQILKAAASRLDRMLRASDDADREAMRTAASRLDDLLRDLRQGNDVSARLKRRTKTNASQKNQE